jgi:uncharacterized protein (TIGR02246 family)
MSDRVQRLIDEADIRDLILRFAQALDAKDWRGYAETFAPDAVFEIMGQHRSGRDAIAAGPERDLQRYDRLQHFVANQVVQVDGDVARGRWYVIAIHIPDAGAPDRHADAGARYRFVAHRTGEDWHFSEVVLEMVWTAGMEFRIEEDPGA